ncbi:MAG: DUF1028 domain-containing protein [Actinomycetota bacterium]|nr:DUF1028 domain-containing protein [Actinomycetota bacterium]
MTFSIVACDLQADPAPEWGVAVASKFLAVGSCVGFGRAGAGAVATQALANVAYGPQGLDLLSSGSSAQEVVESLTRADDGRDDRQLGVVDREGRAATFTGRGCFDWAGGLVSDGYCCQGNILTGSGVIAEMSRAFDSARGELAERLLVALAAGDAAGGDRRGRQSAALLVVREGGGYGGGNDVAVDLRVDDHPAPIPELQRIFGIHRLLMPRPEDLRLIDVDASLAAELRTLLQLPPGTTYDDDVKAALREFIGSENLEERWVDQDRLEQGILDHLRNKSRG